MTKVNIHQAKTQFSRRVNLAAGGEEIIIAKAGKAVARLVPYQPKGVIRRRRPGAMRGKIKIQKKLRRPASKRVAGFVQRQILTRATAPRSMVVVR
ncbi:MAG TPA: type II toxin-antitoxin system Phd/YefM family antitoxin [Candidatus Saccharimonadales bacterium]|nr:type II toxin-antitoxin system Phd/YefM family antitoxin [Candidatus Saccharimonadales bacterium]